MREGEGGKGREREGEKRKRERKRRDGKREWRKGERDWREGRREGEGVRWKKGEGKNVVEGRMRLPTWIYACSHIPNENKR